MKTCFCGCGRTVPRLPLGMRSINKRGHLVSERLAWSRSAADESLDSWVREGSFLLDDIRDAMHGDMDARELDEPVIRDWQKTGWALEADAVAHGIPGISEWLRDDPAAREIAIRVARGDVAARTAAQPGTAPAKSIPDEPLEVEEWLNQAATVAMNEFEPVAELTLQRGTLTMLGLDSFDELDGDAPAFTVGNTRYGYAVRNWECQQIPNAADERPGDPLAARVDERDAKIDDSPDSPYVHPGLDPWLTQLLRGVIESDSPGELEGMLDGMPGAPATVRKDMISVAMNRWGSEEASETRRLLLFGYLLHRVVELRPVI